MQLPERLDNFENVILNIVEKIQMKHYKREWKEDWGKNQAYEVFEKSITKIFNLEFLVWALTP